MSQSNVKNETVCKDCKKPLLTHHTIASIVNGKISAYCHEKPVEPTLGLALVSVLESSAARKKAEADLADFVKKRDEERQAFEAETERKHASAVDAEADKKFERTKVAFETTQKALVEDLKRQLAEAQQKLEGTIALHKDQVAGLNRQVREADGISETLVAEKAELLEKLAASERKSIDLQLQIDELSAKLATFGRLERALRKRTHEFRMIGVGSFSQVIRIGHLEAVISRYEKLYGPLLEEPPQDLETLLRSAEGDDREAPKVSDVLPEAPIAPVRKAVTTPPAPPPAPKASVVTAPPSMKAAASSVAVEVHTPVPPIRTVVLDDASPDPDASASADDEGDGHDHDAHDDIVGEADVEVDVCTGSGCGEEAHEECFYLDADGAEQLILACDPTKHADEFLAHLKKNATAVNGHPVPQSAADVIMSFNPISPN